jgi:ribosome-binding protein aMBF1 (putative translation factor)
MMMAKSATWSEIRGRRLKNAAAKAAYNRASRAFELGEAVRTERERRGWSQSQLAERMGTTQSSVARLEAGSVLPSIETLDRAAAALEADLKVEFRSRLRGSRGLTTR